MEPVKVQQVCAIIGWEVLAIAFAVGAGMLTAAAAIVASVLRRG